MNTDENMLQYVKRKLKNNAYNKAEVMRVTGIRKSTLSEIANDKRENPLFDTVQRIHDYFKKVDR